MSSFNSKFIRIRLNICNEKDVKAMPELLEVNNFKTHSFSKKKVTSAVDGVNLHINKGEPLVSLVVEKV